MSDEAEKPDNAELEEEDIDEFDAMPQLNTADLISGLRDVLDLAEANRSIPEAAYCVIVVPDDGDMVYREFETVEETVEFLRPYYGGSPVQVVVTYGKPCRLTRRPVYLVTHEGKFPLFDIADDSDELLPVGELGSFDHSNDGSIGVSAEPVQDEEDVDEEDVDEETDE